MQCFAVILSKRQQRNLLANFGFQKKSKMNNSEQEGSSSADSSLRNNTTAAPAGTAASERQPIIGPGVTMIQDELTGWRWGKRQLRGADDGDCTCVSLPVNWTSQQWREYLGYLIMCDVRGKGDMDNVFLDITELNQGTDPESIYTGLIQSLRQAVRSNLYY